MRTPFEKPVKTLVMKKVTVREPGVAFRVSHLRDLNVHLFRHAPTFDADQVAASTDARVSDRPFVVELDGKILAGFLYRGPALKFAGSRPGARVIANGRPPGSWRDR